MLTLASKIAFVTGGASGIGRAAAIALAREGAAVAIADHSKQNCSDVCDIITRAGGRVLYLDCDVSDDAQVRHAIEETVKQFRGLDIVMANAGVNGMLAPIEELTPSEWDHTIATNLRGTFLTVHYAIPHLRKSGGGSVIITSSVNGNRSFGLFGGVAYSASKAGQVAFMKMAALELARYDIRVNAICPGAIDTNIEHSTQKRNVESINVPIDFPQGVPGLKNGRGQPEDVADVCLFLAGDMSRHVSGVELYVDGGASLLR